MRKKEKKRLSDVLSMINRIAIYILFLGGLCLIVSMKPENEILIAYLGGMLIVELFLIWIVRKPAAIWKYEKDLANYESQLERMIFDKEHLESLISKNIVSNEKFVDIFKQNTNFIYWNKGTGIIIPKEIISFDYTEFSLLLEKVKASLEEDLSKLIKPEIPDIYQKIAKLVFYKI